MESRYENGMLTSTGYKELSTKNTEYYTYHRWETLKWQKYFWLSIDSPKKILEVGPYLMRVFENSDVIDIQKYMDNTIVHDIRKIPWPVEDNKYDYLVASSVIEHVRPNAKSVIRECRRVSRNGLIIVPYRWPLSATKDHEFIDEETVDNWTEWLVPHISMKYNKFPEKNSGFSTYLLRFYKNWNLSQ